MNQLTIFAPHKGEPSASPFCVKAICLLKMAGVEFETVVGSDPRKAPKGKFPMLETGDRKIADSESIRAYLETEHGVDFDAGLSAEDKAMSHAIIRMFDEHTYFTLLSERWMNEESWANLQSEFFGDIPKLMRGFVSNMIRKSIVSSAKAQGIGRHSADERAARASQDLDVVKTVLGDKPFLFGDTPTAADASVVPVLRSLAILPCETKIKHLVTKDEALMAYIERAKQSVMYKD